MAALVLAAGRSSRMAPHNKLLLRDEAGLAMVTRVAAACIASSPNPVIVVTGHQAPEVAQALHPVQIQAGQIQAGRFRAGGERLQIVHAPDHASGLSASLRHGVRALPAWVDGVVVCLGDMPSVGAGTIDRIIAAFDPACGTAAVVPVWQGARGNPVLWSRAMFSELCALSGDAGARHLLACHPGRIVAVEADGPGVLIDYDSPATLPPGWRAAGGSPA